MYKSTVCKTISKRSRKNSLPPIHRFKPKKTTYPRKNSRSKSCFKTGKEWENKSTIWRETGNNLSRESLNSSLCTTVKNSLSRSICCFLRMNRRKIDNSRTLLTTLWNKKKQPSSLNFRSLNKSSILRAVL